MSKYNKLVFLVSGIIFFLVRITGDMLLHSLDMSRGDTAYYWYFITTTAIFISFGIYFFRDINKNRDYLSDSSGDAFLNSTYQTFVLSLIGVLLVIFFSFKDTSALFKRSYVGLILSDLFFIYTVIVTIINFQFSYKWLWARRHRLTKFYLFMIGLLITIILANEAAIMVLSKDYHSFLQNVSTVVFVIIGLLSFLVNKKTSWIAYLPRTQKTKFFWILMLNIIIAIKLLLETGNDASLVFDSFRSVYPLTLSLLAISFLIYGIYLFRVFMSLLAAMPSSVIVERKSSELSSLTYLNKVIAESANSDRKALFDTVTNLALQASSAYGAWTEIYTDDRTEVSSCVNVKPESIEDLHNIYNIDRYLASLTQPLLFESVREVKEFEPLLKLLPQVKSMIIVPLYTSTRREGTLVIFDSEDFAMEQDDLNILTAFGDNVRIALENSRLVRESVEKERYRNEMMLARTMQKKLLPQVIPQLENYSISAFSIPAMEVGGDYYDVVRLKNGNYCYLIGDVSGKGISAAFYMSQLKGVVLSKAQESESAMELLCKINSILYKNMESQMFITMSAVSVNDNKGNISIARAGHMPFIYKSDGIASNITPKGIGIGLTGELIFNENIEQKDLFLKVGDSLILYTDGLNEMRNSDGVEFGFDKLKNKIELLTTNDAIEFIDEIKSTVNNFAGDYKHHDDMTMLILMKH